MKTTLNKIRENHPCTEGWEKLLRSLNKTKADHEPVSIIQVLDSNGLDDALWCLRAVSGYDREIRLYAVWCARQVEHLMEDHRSKDALNVAERFANGEAEQEELAAAREAARDVAREAARDVAWDAARDVAWDAAREAARDVAWEAARDVAWAAARDVAWAAARAAAWAAARAAARAAAWDAAWAAARDVQEKELRRLCAAIEAREKAEA